MQNSKMIYIYDTLCGWCYVASPVMKQISDFALENGISFEFHHRQLFTGAHVPFMSDEFLKMIRRVGSETAPRMTGIAFSEKYYTLVKSEDFEHNSHLTALGVAAAKQLAINDKKAFDYGKQLQDLIFQEGQSPSNITTIIKAAQGLFDIDEFSRILESERTRSLASEESAIALEFSSKHGESGIPFLYYYEEGEQRYTKLDPFRLDKAKEIVKNLNADIIQQQILQVY